MQNPNIPKTPDRGQGLLAGFQDWAATPQGKATLLQFGASMLQPVPVGQSLGGHIGAALGAGGEAAARQASSDAAAAQQEFDNNIKTERLKVARTRAAKAGSSRSTMSLSQMLRRRDAQQKDLRKHLFDRAEEAVEAHNLAHGLDNQIDINSLLNDPTWVQNEASLYNQINTVAGGGELASSAPAPTIDLSHVPPAAIERLKADPRLAEAFDNAYNVPGAAAQILGK